MMMIDTYLYLGSNIDN